MRWWGGLGIDLTMEVGRGATTLKGQGLARPANKDRNPNSIELLTGRGQPPCQKRIEVVCGH